MLLSNVLHCSQSQSTVEHVTYSKHKLKHLEHQIAVEFIITDVWKTKARLLSTKFTFHYGGENEKPIKGARALEPQKSSCLYLQ